MLLTMTSHTNFLVESPVAKYVPLAQRYAQAGV